jgi:putative transposase
MKKRHREEQIIWILREAEAQEVPIREMCRQHNVSEQTFYGWRDKYGGMEIADAHRLKEFSRKTRTLLNPSNISGC